MQTVTCYLALCNFQCRLSLLNAMGDAVILHAASSRVQHIRLLFEARCASVCCLQKRRHGIRTYKNVAMAFAHTLIDLCQQRIRL